MSREIKTEQNYFEKLLRLIPSEIVAAYLIITGIIPYDASKWGNIIVSLIMLIIIPFYLWRVLNVNNLLQIITTTIAFIIWIYSVNVGLFNSFGLYRPWIASIALILWTLIMPILIVPNKEEPEPKIDKVKNNKTIKTGNTSKKKIKKTLNKS